MDIFCSLVKALGVKVLISNFCLKYFLCKLFNPTSIIQIIHQIFAGFFSLSMFLSAVGFSCNSSQNINCSDKFQQIQGYFSSAYFIKKPCVSRWWCQEASRSLCSCAVWRSSVTMRPSWLRSQTAAALQRPTTPATSSPPSLIIWTTRRWRLFCSRKSLSLCLQQPDTNQHKNTCWAAEPMMLSAGLKLSDK